MTSQDDRRPGENLGGAARLTARALNELLVAAGIAPVSEATEAKFDAYLRLLLRWSQRTNLTAIRGPEEIVSRHFVESIACARGLPDGIRSLLDFGSGAGFPGIPIALCRPEIEVTLAESQGKKAAFLREAVRLLELSAVVHGNRAEELGVEFDCVALRAVDQMARAVTAAAKLVRRSGSIAIMTTTAGIGEIRDSLGEEFVVNDPSTLPGSNQRILILASRSGKTAREC